MEGGQKRALHLGGLSGLLAGLVMLVGLILAVAFPIAAIASVEDYLTTTPETKSVYLTIVRLGYLASLLFIPLLLALQASLGKMRPSSTNLATALGFTAAAVFVVYFLALGNTALALSERYGTVAPGERATVAVAGEAALGVLHGIQVAGFFFLGLSFIAFGVSMLANEASHKGFGWVGVVFGAVVIGLPFTGVSNYLTFPLWTIFSLLIGGKVYSLSRAK